MRTQALAVSALIARFLSPGEQARTAGAASSAIGGGVGSLPRADLATGVPVPAPAALTGGPGTEVPAFDPSSLFTPGNMVT